VRLIRQIYICSHNQVLRVVLSLGVFLGFYCSFLGVAKIAEFPDHQGLKNVVFIENATLFLNGRAVHRRYFFDIYEVSLFLKDLQKNPEDIIQSSELKFARMKFLRDLKAEDLKDGFSSSFNDNCLDICEILKSDVERFLTFIPDMAEDTVIEFIFYPDKTRVLASDNRELVIQSSVFSKVLLRSWLGASPPSERFKKELLGLSTH